MTRTRAADKKEDAKVETLKANSKGNVSNEESAEKPSLVNDLKKDKRQSIRLAARSTPTKELEAKSEPKRAGRATPAKKALEVSEKPPSKRKTTVEEKDTPKKKKEDDKKTSKAAEGKTKKKEEVKPKARRKINEKTSENEKGEGDKENCLPDKSKEEEAGSVLPVTPKVKASDDGIVTSANKSSGGKSLKDVRSRHIPESDIDTPRGSRRRSTRLSVSTPKHKELSERIIGKRKNVSVDKDSNKKLKSEVEENVKEKSAQERKEEEPKVTEHVIDKDISSSEKNCEERPILIHKKTSDTTETTQSGEKDSGKIDRFTEESSGLEKKESTEKPIACTTEKTDTMVEECTEIGLAASISSVVETIKIKEGSPVAGGAHKNLSPESSTSFVPSPKKEALSPVPASGTQSEGLSVEVNAGVNCEVAQNPPVKEEPKEPQENEAEERNPVVKIEQPSLAESEPNVTTSVKVEVLEDASEAGNRLNDEACTSIAVSSMSDEIEVDSSEVNSSTLENTEKLQVQNTETSKEDVETFPAVVEAVADSNGTTESSVPMEQDDKIENRVGQDRKIEASEDTSKEEAEKNIDELKVSAKENTEISNNEGVCKSLEAPQETSSKVRSFGLEVIPESEEETKEASSIIEGKELSDTTVKDLGNKEVGTGEAVETGSDIADVLPVAESTKKSDGLSSEDIKEAPVPECRSEDAVQGVEVLREDPEGTSGDSKKKTLESESHTNADSADGVDTSREDPEVTSGAPIDEAPQSESAKVTEPVVTMEGTEGSKEDPEVESCDSAIDGVDTSRKDSEVTSSAPTDEASQPESAEVTESVVTMEDTESSKEDPKVESSDAIVEAPKLMSQGRVEANGKEDSMKNLEDIPINDETPKDKSQAKPVILEAETLKEDPKAGLIVTSDETLGPQAEVVGNEETSTTDALGDISNTTAKQESPLVLDEKVLVKDPESISNDTNNTTPESKLQVGVELPVVCDESLINSTETVPSSTSQETALPASQLEANTVETKHEGTVTSHDSKEEPETAVEDVQDSASVEEASDEDEVNITLAVESSDLESPSKQREVDQLASPFKGIGKKDMVKEGESSESIVNIHPAKLAQNVDATENASKDQECVNIDLTEMSDNLGSDESSNEEMDGSAEKVVEKQTSDAVVPTGTKRKYKSAFIRDLDISVTNEDLEKVFSYAGFGKLKGVKLVKKVYAVVEFESEKDFEKAITIQNELKLNGVPLKIGPNEHERCKKAKRSRHRRGAFKTHSHHPEKRPSSPPRGGMVNSPRKVYSMATSSDPKNLFTNAFERMQQRNKFQPPTRYFSGGRPQQQGYNNGNVGASNMRPAPRHHHHHHGHSSSHMEDPRHPYSRNQY